MKALRSHRGGGFEVASFEGSAELKDVERLRLFRELLDGGRSWEVEIGFGKGRYLLARAESDSATRFLGIEVAGEYFGMVCRRMVQRKLENVLLVRGEARACLAAVLPSGFAQMVHVYFPDPWPKGRHAKRRLLQPSTIDLLLRPLKPGGRLYFATDFLDYGREVRALFESHPACRVLIPGFWPDGARTHYELKYTREGRDILRLEVELLEAAGWHPESRLDLLVAYAERAIVEPTELMEASGEA